jgi:epoxyqueuosine reductase
MLAWDESTFSKRLQGSPMRRLKLRRFQRNLCVVLGNVGTMTDLPALQLVSSGEDKMVAEHANWAIERIKGRD